QRHGGFLAVAFLEGRLERPQFVGCHTSSHPALPPVPITSRPASVLQFMNRLPVLPTRTWRPWVHGKHRRGECFRLWNQPPICLPTAAAADPEPLPPFAGWQR